MASASGSGGGEPAQTEDQIPAQTEDQIPALYEATLDAPPTPEDLRAAEARKQVLRALDAKVSQQDDVTALRAIRLLLRLVRNVVTEPINPKYQRFKASNPTIRTQLLQVPGSTSLLIGLGFHTCVHEFEEHWALADVSQLSVRILSEGLSALEQYEQIVSKRQEQSATKRQEKIAGATVEKQLTLAQIEEDRQERRMRSKLMKQAQPSES